MIFHAFLAFGSISQHFHHTKSQSLLQDPGPASVDQLKIHACKQPLNHRDFGNLIPRPFDFKNWSRTIILDCVQVKNITINAKT